MFPNKLLAKLGGDDELDTAIMDPPFHSFSDGTPCTHLSLSTIILMYCDMVHRRNLGIEFHESWL